MGKGSKYKKYGRDIGGGRRREGEEKLREVGRGREGKWRD